jgi:hypothetical protein
VASSHKLASNLDTSNFLEDLSKNLLQEVLSTVEKPQTQTFLSSPFAANANYTSPFALSQQPVPQQVVRTSSIKSEFQGEQPVVTYSYREPSQKIKTIAATPYEKLVNRKRRVRKGKVVHGRKEKQCDWCKTTGKNFPANFFFPAKFFFFILIFF